MIPSSDSLTPRDSARTAGHPAASNTLEVATQHEFRHRDALGALEGVITAVRVALRTAHVVIDVTPRALESTLARYSAGQKTVKSTAVFGLDSPIVGMMASRLAADSVQVAIEDLRMDTGIRGAVSMRGTRILSMAAHPLTDYRGQPIGALVAMDGVPRFWSATDLLLLRELAAAVEGLMTPPARDIVPTAPTIAVSSTTDTHFDTFAAEVLEHLSDAILIVDEQWQVRWANDLVSEFFGVSPALLRAGDLRDVLRPVIDDAIRATWTRAAHESRPTSFAWHHAEADRFFDGTARSITSGLLITVRDLTTQRRAERARDQKYATGSEAERLRTIAQLAGGVAHDFNNLLTVISANTELLALTSETVSATREIAEVLRATTRATALTNQLLAFGRQLPLQPVGVSLNSIVADIEADIRSRIPSTVQYETSLTVQDTEVYVDDAQLQRAVLLLVKNAAEAMLEGGRLSITTATRTLHLPLAAKPASVPAGSWVILEVRDSGCGIPADVIDHIFEPFFTTRAIGEGLGMGLATAYGIVAQSGGSCTVESIVARGTVFRFWLPAHLSVTSFR